ncbi:hypothetical protein RB213_001923 [Colletotrichum asianum]
MINPFYRPLLISQSKINLDVNPSRFHDGITNDHIHPMEIMLMTIFGVCPLTMLTISSKQDDDIGFKGPRLLQDLNSYDSSWRKSLRQLVKLCQDAFPIASRDQPADASANDGICNSISILWGIGAHAANKPSSYI